MNNDFIGILKAFLLSLLWGLLFGLLLKVFSYLNNL